MYGNADDLLYPLSVLTDPYVTCLGHSECSVYILNETGDSEFTELVVACLTHNIDKTL
jgi:hypothetical protein